MKRRSEKALQPNSDCGRSELWYNIATCLARLAVACHIFTALIGEIAKRPEAQTHELVVEGVELAHGRDVEQDFPKQCDVSLKGALGWNQPAQQPGELGIADFYPVQPLAQGLQWVESGVLGGIASSCYCTHRGLCLANP